MNHAFRWLPSWAVSSNVHVVAGLEAHNTLNSGDVGLPVEGVSGEEGGAELPPDAPKDRRRWWRRRAVLIASVLAVLIALAGSAIGWLVYAATYQPLQPGNFGGPRLSMTTVSDGIRETEYIVTGRPLTVGAVEFSLWNSGSTAVRLLGLADNSGPVIQLRWGPEVDKNGLGGGTYGEAKPLPVTLTPNTSISLWFLVQRPKCQAPLTEEISQVGIRWQSLGFNHVYQFQLGAASYLPYDMPIAVCYPAAALKHIG